MLFRFPNITRIRYIVLFPSMYKIYTAHTDTHTYTHIYTHKHTQNFDTLIISYFNNIILIYIAIYLENLLKKNINIFH